MTYTTASHAPAIHVAVLPTRVDVHWETQHRLVWNEQKHVGRIHLQRVQSVFNRLTVSNGFDS